MNAAKASSKVTLNGTGIISAARRRSPIALRPRPGLLKRLIGPVPSPHELRRGNMKLLRAGSRQSRLATHGATGRDGPPHPIFHQ